MDVIARPRRELAVDYTDVIGRPRRELAVVYTKNRYFIPSWRFLRKVNSRASVITYLVPIHKRSIFPISALRRLLKCSHISICCAFKSRCALILKKYPRLWTGTI